MFKRIPSSLRTRIVFLALALGTIALGLLVHWHGSWLPTAVQDSLGDALWAMMIAWWLGTVLPNSTAASRAGFAIALCWTVEVSQLYHTPALDGWRQTVPGQLILGSGFDPRDLGAYVVGVVGALILETTLRRRPASS